MFLPCGDVLGLRSPGALANFTASNERKDLPKQIDQMKCDMEVHASRTCDIVGDKDGMVNSE